MEIRRSQSLTLFLPSFHVCLCVYLVGVGVGVYLPWCACHNMHVAVRGTLGYQVLFFHRGLCGLNTEICLLARTDVFVI